MPSNHFDGKRFFTPGAPQPKSFADVARWMLTRHPEPWKSDPSSTLDHPPATVREGLRTTLVNHSTVLIQTAGVNILTDPIWSERASPFTFAGPKRFAPPGIRFEDLPPIHIVLISHNHYDHMDLPTLRRLQSAHAPRVYVGLGNAPYLMPIGMKRAFEMDWWDSDCYSSDITVHCTPSQHFSARSPFDRNRALWCSYVIATPSGNIYFGGDTGFGPHFRDIHQRFPYIRIALLPIGAYLPRWFMSPVHLSPDEAFEAHKILGAHDSVAIHHGTFALADDSQYEARDRVIQLALERNLQFHILRNGESWTSESTTV